MLVRGWAALPLPKTFMLHGPKASPTSCHQRPYRMCTKRVCASACPADGFFESLSGAAQCCLELLAGPWTSATADLRSVVFLRVLRSTARSFMPPPPRSSTVRIPGRRVASCGPRGRSAENQNRSMTEGITCAPPTPLLDAFRGVRRVGTPVGR